MHVSYTSPDAWAAGNKERSELLTSTVTNQRALAHHRGRLGDVGKIDGPDCPTEWSVVRMGSHGQHITQVGRKEAANTRLPKLPVLGYGRSSAPSSSPQLLPARHMRS